MYQSFACDYMGLNCITTLKVLNDWSIFTSFNIIKWVIFIAMGWYLSGVFHKLCAYEIPIVCIAVWSEK